MSSGRRREAIVDLERLRLKLTTVGGFYADLVETMSWNAFVTADDLFNPRSTPTSWVRNGAAAWVQGYRAQINLYNHVCSTLLRRRGPPSGPRSGVYNGAIHFYVDQHTEATDPVPTTIPLAEINSVRIGLPNNLTVGNFNLTVSSNNKKVLLAMVGVGRLNLAPTPPNAPMTLPLNWPSAQKPTAFYVHVLDTR